MDHFLAGCEPLTICRTGSRAPLALPRGWRCLCPASWMLQCCHSPRRGLELLGSCQLSQQRPGAPGHAWQSPEGLCRQMPPASPAGTGHPWSRQECCWEHSCCLLAIARELLPRGSVQGAHTLLLGLVWGSGRVGRALLCITEIFGFSFPFFILIYLMLPHSMVVSP